MILIVKGKPELRWCDKHEHVYRGRKCPRCASAQRWTRKRYEAIAAYVQAIRESERAKIAI